MNRIDEITDVPTIEYARGTDRRRPPFDWGGAGRQAVFAVGTGLIVAGFTLWCSTGPWDDRTAYAALIGLGTGIVALTLPWPGRIGRRRR